MAIPPTEWPIKIEGLNSLQTTSTNFEYKIGGNTTLGDNGYSVAWMDLPGIFGFEGLPESGVIETVVDQYII